MKLFTAGEVYFSRAPIHTLGFSRVRHLFPVLLWTNDFRLSGEGRLLPTDTCMEISIDKILHNEIKKLYPLTINSR